MTPNLDRLVPRTVADRLDEHDDRPSDGANAVLNPRGRPVGEAGSNGAKGSNGTDGSDEEELVTPADRIRRGLLTTEQVKRLEPPQALVDGLLYQDSLAMLYGASGLGKSFVAIDLAQHLTHGAYWNSRAVSATTVLYVVAEGASGVGVRLDAWERHHQLRSAGKGIDWLPWAVNIYDAGWAAALAEVVAERQPGFVVLDTFARCALGAEENGARDVGLVVAHLDGIRRAAASCVLLVHHAGKDTAAGARGSSALRAAMHTEIELSGDVARLTFKVTKQKDGPEASPFVMRLHPVPGTDSAVMLRSGGSEADDAELAGQAAATLAALESIDVAGGIPSGTWEKVTGAAQRTFFRHRKVLVDRDLVVNVGTDHQPRYRPTSAVSEEVALVEGPDEVFP